MIISHLPEGPTAQFKVTSIVEQKHIKNHGRVTNHLPEIILNNFTTRLGHRVGRFLGSLFPHDPEFLGRKVVTFHNQRDFIFVRHHRYIFEEDKRNLPAPQSGVGSSREEQRRRKRYSNSRKNARVGATILLENAMATSKCLRYKRWGVRMVP